MARSGKECARGSSSQHASSCGTPAWSSEVPCLTWDEENYPEKVGRSAVPRGPASVKIINPVDLDWVRRLGEGAYATVEECVLHGETVAVKALKQGLVDNEIEAKGFVNEGAIMAELNHPFIVRIVGLGYHTEDVVGGTLDTDTLFQVQGFCSGGSLRSKVLAQMLAYNKVLYTYGDGLRWCTQVCCALAYLHDQNPKIIHRDVKLDNILLTDSTAGAAVKLADFGLAALVSSKEVKRVADLTGREAIGEMTGETGSYLNMAPEMMNGTVYDEKVDIFSLGCCIFEVFSKAITVATVTVTGEKDELRNIALKVASGYRRAIPHEWPLLLRGIIGDCWEQDPTLRPSASELVPRLETRALIAGVQAMDVTEGARLGGCCVLQ